MYEFFRKNIQSEKMGRIMTAAGQAKSYVLTRDTFFHTISGNNTITSSGDFFGSFYDANPILGLNLIHLAEECWKGEKLIHVVPGVAAGMFFQKMAVDIISTSFEIHPFIAIGVATALVELAKIGVERGINLYQKISVQEQRQAPITTLGR